MTDSSLAARVRDDAARIATLAVPLLFNNLAIAGMTFVDTVMVGRLGAPQLAAVAVGAAYFNFFYLAGLGLLMAMSPTVAHAYGAGREEEVGTFFRQALWLSLAMSVCVIVGLAFAYPLMLLIGIPPEVARVAAGYTHAISFGVPPLFAFFALRFSSEGLGWTRPILFTAAIAVICKIAGNSVFIYGNFGAPALGPIGSGVATAIVEWIIFIFMFLYVRRHRVYAPYRPLRQMEKPSARRLREILALGLPICGSVLAEGALFVAAALILGTFGATVVAAHAIAINYASLMFMVPLSLHSATTIHVGHEVGRGDAEGGRLAGWVGIGMCVSIMAVSAIVLLLTRSHIAGLYTEDSAVLSLATYLLLFAAVFQVADGLQVGAAGALRGFKDAQVPMMLNLFSYWAVGFSLAWYFGVARGHGAPAVWTGLIAGLFLCALLLSLRYRFVSRRAVRAKAHTSDRSRSFP